MPLHQLFGSPVPQLDPQSAKTKLDASPQPFLLDVREPDEYQIGHIPGAVLIPLGELQRRIHELPRDREIICVCHSGHRSGAATQHLVSAGYPAVNLAGGMLGWARHGLPIKRGASQ